MSNEETIYECSADNTRWYGSNNVPEVCPVCNAKGSISVPQDFDSTAEKDAAIASIEPVIESAPVADETPVATIEQTAEILGISAEEISEGLVDGSITTEGDVSTDASNSGSQEINPDAESVEPAPDQASE